MSQLDQQPTEFDLRIDDFISKLLRIEAHVRVGEKRAARAQLEGLLDELQQFADEIALPMDSMVIGAQLGFMSGGNLLRGRIPAGILGLGLGWLYGQSKLVDKRKVLNQLVDQTAAIAMALERLENAPAETG